jgi:hypothetical protein
MVRRGHEVVTVGGGAHRDFFERGGAAFVEAITAEKYYEAISDPDAFHPRKGVQTVMRWIGEYLERGVEILDEVWEPDSTIVSHTIVMSARIFEEARGARSATVVAHRYADDRPPHRARPQRLPLGARAAPGIPAVEVLAQLTSAGHRDVAGVVRAGAARLAAAVAAGGLPPR